MTIRRYLIAVLLLMIFGLKVPAQTADSLQLEEVFALALAHASPAMRAQTDLLQAQLRHRSYRASLMPQLNLSGSVPNYVNTFSPTTQPDGSIAFQRIAYNNSVLSMELSQPITPLGSSLFVQTNLQRFDNFSDKSTRYNGVPLRVGIRQPVSAYNPMKWRARLDPVQVREARKQYHFDLESVRATTLQLFFDLLLAQIDGELARNNLKSSESLFLIAQERYALGKISENDLLQLQLEQINARKALQDATQAVDLAFTRLCALLGRNTTERFFLQIPRADSLPPVQVEEALRLAAHNRPEFETWYRNRLEAGEATASTKSQYGFQATVQASVGYAGSAATLSPVYQSALPEQVLSMQVNVPIVNWGRGKFETQIRTLEEDYVARSQEVLQQELESSVRQVVGAHQRVQQTFAYAQQAQEIAQRQFDISQSRYRLGEISTTDLTLSLRAKDLARRAYIGSLREYWQTRQSLRMLTLFDFDSNQPISYPDP